MSIRPRQLHCIVQRVVVLVFLVFVNVITLPWASASPAPGPPVPSDGLDGEVVPRSESVSFFFASLRSGADLKLLGTESAGGYSPAEAIRLTRLLVSGSGGSGNPQTLTIGVYKNDLATQVFEFQKTIQPATSAFTTEETVPTISGNELLAPGDDFFATVEFSDTPMLSSLVFDLSITVEWAAVDVQGVYNVRHYGATGDGVTDDRPAIEDAILAAEASIVGGAKAVVYFPPGEYAVRDEVRVLQSGITLEGAGIDRSVIGPTGSFPSGKRGIVRFEGPAAQTQLSDCGIRKLTISGNLTREPLELTELEAGLVLIDIRHFQASDIRVRDIEGMPTGAPTRAGIFSDTTAMGNNTLTVGNHYSNIFCDRNAGDGMIFRAEKNSRFSDLNARCNGRDGIVFQASKTMMIRETTQCTVANLKSSDNSGAGLVLDGTARYTLASVNINANFGAGVSIRNTYGDSKLTGEPSSGVISFTLSSVMLRNNGKDPNAGSNMECLGTQIVPLATQIETQANAIVNGAVISGLRIQSPNSLDLPMVHMRGWQNVHMSAVHMVSGNGTGILVEDGLGAGPDPASFSSGNITITGLTIVSVIGSEAGGYDGIHLRGSTDNPTFDVIIDDVILENLGTKPNAPERSTSTISGYEVHLGENVTAVQIDSYSIAPAAVGHEFFAEGDSAAELSTSSGFVRNDVAHVPTVPSQSSISPRLYTRLLNISGTNDIEHITPRPANEMLYLHFVDPQPGKLKHGTMNLVLGGLSDIQPSEGDVVVLISDGQSWHGSL